MREVLKINLFFLLKRNYRECVVTTKTKISKKYAKKFTLELETAKDWDRGILISSIGSVDAYDPKKYTNKKFYFIKTGGWFKGAPSSMYLVIEKKVADGGEYYTPNIRRTLNGSMCNVFLFESKG